MENDKDKAEPEKPPVNVGQEASADSGSYGTENVTKGINLDSGGDSYGTDKVLKGENP